MGIKFRQFQITDAYAFCHPFQQSSIYCSRHFSCKKLVFLWLVGQIIHEICIVLMLYNEGIGLQSINIYLQITEYRVLHETNT